MTTDAVGSPSWDATIDLAPLGALLDALDVATAGDSDQDEHEAYRAALDEALDILFRFGFLIPRAADNNPDCSCGNADYGTHGHEGD